MDLILILLIQSDHTFVTSYDSFLAVACPNDQITEILTCAND